MKWTHSSSKQGQEQDITQRHQQQQAQVLQANDEDDDKAKAVQVDSKIVYYSLSDFDLLNTNRDVTDEGEEVAYSSSDERWTQMIAEQLGIRPKNNPNESNRQSEQ